MPEIVEVETIVRQLRTAIVGSSVKELSIFDDKIFLPEDKLIGQEIKAVERIGKYILFKFDDFYLVSHLRMTGQWLIKEGKFFDSLDKHIRAVFVLCKDGVFGPYLYFRDVRRFGTIKVEPDLSVFNEKLGVDGLSVCLEENLEFISRKAKKSKRPIKTFLMDQKNIAGSGNIYCSQALWEAKIHPAQPAKDVNIKALCFVLKEIFERSLKFGGTTISNYTDGTGERGLFQNELKTYGREGQPCPRCKNKIIKLKQAGRSTFYCPECQVF